MKFGFKALGGYIQHMTIATTEVVGLQIGHWPNKCFVSYGLTCSYHLSNHNTAIWGRCLRQSLLLSVHIWNYFNLNRHVTTLSIGPCHDAVVSYHMIFLLLSALHYHNQNQYNIAVLLWKEKLKSYVSCARYSLQLILLCEQGTTQTNQQVRPTHWTGP